ncbi:DUF4149 domain-containing protein [Roseisolibacter agri]|nr:DUF4149 domain-containing protein [Roseisolibacter agri]
MSPVGLAMPGRLLAAAALLAAWIGAAALVAAVVAPAAFSVLPTRALAGALVGRVLPVIFLTGLAVGLGAAVLGWHVAPAFARTRLVLPLLTALACGVAQFGIAPRIQRLRAEMGPSIEALPTTDPRRAQFGRLHGISVAFMGAGLLAAGAALVLTAVAATRER